MKNEKFLNELLSITEKENGSIGLILPIRLN